ncbi:MAG TPA: zinc-dependent alcohol dehydrogenase [Phycisphaerae bacterium]|nr:zinc-dependent alcohol dehydrogenase [Phycisphaerae bacterium]HOJ73933.1 zinc-dependent alcohol dehydrogenase [Phycisphaerae bacterium]HOM50874.1 zinc-dependent alcohol dehydrogenase [Phycisphaerae bacterium]HPP25951.1 zinc-dependent alcohol dehydrogenase [Phycisphaerae bacterium]HPZ97203.1 zinc-dependent alcohol dehydrogenase [Phycisphaerae bacterium]
MKAVVFHDVGDVRLDDVPEPTLREPHDAIVRITATAICGTDLHMIRGTVGEMVSGTILGHEGVGVVEEVGSGVRNFKPGDRVVIPSTIGCGYCSYCRAGYFAQCDNANPNGLRAGTCFYGGPRSTGPIDGLQAEWARVPFANVNLVRLPEEVDDDDAILLSDIFPTGYFGAEQAEIKPGDTVAVFGCGPVGQFAILSALLMGAGRVIAVDTVPCRLQMARNVGAEVVDFNREDPVEAILELTGGIGVDRAIDAVGVDAIRPKGGPAAAKSFRQQDHFRAELQQVAPITHPDNSGHWTPGDAPSQAIEWAVEALAKAGTLSVIGFYPPTMDFFPFGMALSKNLTLNAGNCNHRRYIPHLLELIESGAVNLTPFVTNLEPLSTAVDAYKAFDERQTGWIKVELIPELSFACTP